MPGTPTFYMQMHPTLLTNVQRPLFTYLTSQPFIMANCLWSVLAIISAFKVIYCQIISIFGSFDRSFILLFLLIIVILIILPTTTVASFATISSTSKSVALVRVTDFDNVTWIRGHVHTAGAVYQKLGDGVTSSIVLSLAITAIIIVVDEIRVRRWAFQPIFLHFDGSNEMDCA